MMNNSLLFGTDGVFSYAPEYDEDYDECDDCPDEDRYVYDDDEL